MERHTDALPRWPAIGIGDVVHGLAVEVRVGNARRIVRVSGKSKYQLPGPPTVGPEGMLGLYWMLQPVAAFFCCAEKGGWLNEAHPAVRSRSKAVPRLVRPTCDICG